MAKECINRLILYRHNHFYSFKMILTQATLDIKLRYDGSIFIDNTEPFVFKKTPTKLGAFDVAQSDKDNQYGDYVFRGVVETKNWGAEDDEVLGKDGAAAYGFAATATEDIEVGQFVKVGEGAYIRPFRGYIYKKPVPKMAKGVYLKKIKHLTIRVGNMKNEAKQKKEYSTLTVKVVELKHQAQLMETSGSEPPTTGGGLL